MNAEGEPLFEPAKNTPTDINNLLTSPALLDNNPNLNPANGTGASNPFRLDRTQANTADQNHGYTPEQQAFDGGKLDLFPLDTGAGTTGGAAGFGTKAQVMGYFDGNTVTGLWNYAQNFAMSDNSWSDTFGPSTPGALKMFAGQTNGATFPGVPAGTPVSVIAAELTAGDAGVLNSDGSFTLTGDIDPFGDVCSSPSAQVRMTSKNIGDLLNAAIFRGVRSSVVSTCKPSTTTARPVAAAAAFRLSPAAGTAIMFRIISGSSTSRRRPIRPTPVRPRPRRSATPPCRARRPSIRPTMPTT